MRKLGKEEKREKHNGVPDRSPMLVKLDEASALPTRGAAPEVARSWEIKHPGRIRRQKARKPRAHSPKLTQGPRMRCTGTVRCGPYPRVLGRAGQTRRVDRRRGAQGRRIGSPSPRAPQEN